MGARRVFDLISLARELGSDLGPFANLVTFSVPAFAGGSILVAKLFHARLRRSTHLIDAYKDDISRRDEKLHVLGGEKLLLEQRLKEVDPAAAIERAEQDWLYNNKMRAIRGLEKWFEANAESIAAIAVHLAKFHISQSIPDPGKHLDQARAMLRLARGASPNNREAEETAGELDRVNAALQERLIRNGEAQIAWNPSMSPRVGAQGEEFRPIVYVFRDIAQFCFDKGLWRLMPIFADRAADFAWSGERVLRPLWLEVEASAAFYQIVVGNGAAGLQRVDHVLAVAHDFLPAHDPIVLKASYIHATALERLGRYSDSLAEIDTTIVAAKATGDWHPAAPAVRYLRAKVLGGLGRYAKALSEIDAFAAVEAVARGDRDVQVLNFRYLRAQMLRDLGRYREALVELDAFAPIQADVCGDRHPDILTTRWLRAVLLENLGRYGEALADVEAFAPI